MSSLQGVMFQRWYSVVDDTVGGWAIANVDKPTSEIDTRGDTERELAFALTKIVADHVVQLHNAWLARGRM